MSRNQSREETREFDRARDELFSHIHRCGVLKATADQQRAWIDDTMEFMAERYPELSSDQMGELRAIGMRFCSPVIANADADVAPEGEQESDAADAGAAAA